MKECEIIERVPKLFQETLNGLQVIRDVEVQPGKGTDLASPDFMVMFNLPALGRSGLILVEVKNRGEPRVIREAVNHLLQCRKEPADETPSSYLAVVARYISPKSAEICREAGVGYLDLAGNCMLNYSLFSILREGKPNSFRIKRPLKTIYGEKATRVLRVLLETPSKRWKLQDLRNEADVSVGLVYKVKEALCDLEWAASDKDGFYLVQPGELLKDWAANYSIRKKNQIFEFYSLESAADIELRLVEACEKTDTKFAFTGFSAGARLAPAVRYKRVSAFIENRPEEVAAAANLKPVSSGANVWLLTPYDEGVFYGTRTTDSRGRVVSPIQAYLDLMSLRERGEEAAEALFREEIKKRW